MIQLWDKLKESLQSILPIFGIVILLNLFRVINLDGSLIINFSISTILLILSTTLFTLGADIAMTPMGEHVGKELVKRKKISIIVVVMLVMGILITIAEPDLSVLAEQVASDTLKQLLIKVSVAIGVGIFLVLAILKIIFKIPLKYILLISYAVVFIVAIFLSIINPNFTPLAFDSGGVTTGPITVPFIMAIGSGVALINDDKDDSFGLVALCSIGPILAVSILGIIMNSNPSNTSSESLNFFNILLKEVKEVSLCLLPIVLFFVLFNLIFKKMSKDKLKNVIKGLIYAYFGLIVFLTAINYGFVTTGSEIGKQIALKNKYLLIPLGLVLGAVTVLAEPAVHVLIKQVEEISEGRIRKLTILISLSIAVGVSIALSMIRSIFDFSILWYLIPGYIICIVLAFVIPKLYSAIAFDSGGVASGPMTSGFVLSLAIGASATLNTSGGFGVVAMVAMTPILTVEILGCVPIVKSFIADKIKSKRKVREDENQIIYF